VGNEVKTYVPFAVLASAPSTSGVSPWPQAVAGGSRRLRPEGEQHADQQQRGRSPVDRSGGDGERRTGDVRPVVGDGRGDAGPDQAG
jgi:hypothetical protein